MYDNSNCPIGADNEYSPWNQKELKSVQVGISLEISKEIELKVDTESDETLLNTFLNSDEYIHLQKILNSANLNIDNIDIFEI